MFASRQRALWAVIREIGSALGVLALVFLSFAHQPAVGSEGVGIRFSDGSVPVFCGPAPLGSNDAEPARGCDICRLTNAIVLPQPACNGAETIRVAKRIFFEPVHTPVHWGAFIRTGHARAPPLIS